MSRPILAAGIAVTAFALFQPAEAETLTKTLAGTKLEVHMACPAEIKIEPRADLGGKIEVEATADEQAALDGIQLSGGEVARIEYSEHCRAAEGLQIHGDLDIGGLHLDNIHIGDSSLELAIRVPPGLPIEIRSASEGEYEIGAVAGPLALKLSGASELHAEHLSSLDLDSAGAAEIHIDRLDGPGVVVLHGGGEVTISDGKMPSLNVDSRGAGEIEVEGGEIGTLDISIAGAGNAEIHAPVRDATLKIAGIGNIEVEKVTGTVHRDIAGLGNIDIGD
jgi:hypothetical protein